MPTIRRPVPTLTLALSLAACAHHPPAGFAPDPGLVARIQSIEMATAPSACPGQSFGAGYAAVLDDGTRVTFAAGYDADHPPPLHVSFLDRTSPQARALDNGGWAVVPDPLASTEGIALHVVLRQAPRLVIDTVLPPDYGCLPHALRFEGNPGVDGPDITVRLAQGHSSYYPQLLIVAVEVRGAATRYVLADATSIPPRGWLVVESVGGHGVRGSTGRAGADGTAGAPCAAGGDGRAGEAGGDGGPGGRGGHVVIVAPNENPFLAGVVEARTPGGKGGEAGRGGSGGRGGAGGAAAASCTAGRPGVNGAPGPNGSPGRDGGPGSLPQVITVPNAQVFGNHLPPQLARLLTAGQ